MSLKYTEDLGFQWRHPEVVTLLQKRSHPGTRRAHYRHSMVCFDNRFRRPQSLLMQRHQNVEKG